MNKKGILLPIVLGLIIAVLAGIIIYLTFKDSGKIEEIPNTEGVSETVTEEADRYAVYGEIKNAGDRVLAVSVLSSKTKSTGLKKAAEHLYKAADYCTDKEESLKQSLIACAAELYNIGEKTESGVLSEADGQNLEVINHTIGYALETSKRAIDENNADYLRGSFEIPVMTAETKINRETADTLAAKAVDSPEFKAEESSYYSYSGDNYVLEVDKTDGTVHYRQYGYEKTEGELTAQKLDELKNHGKSVLAQKGYESTVLYEWQYTGGEVSLLFYPFVNDTLYFNCPLGIVVSESDKDIKGLRLSTFNQREVKDNDALLKIIKENSQSQNYIVKAVDKWGHDCYAVEVSTEGGDYLSLWSMEKDRETAVFKWENTLYGKQKTEVL